MAGRERKRGLSESSEEEGTLEKVARMDVVANDLATSGSSSDSDSSSSDEEEDNDHSKGNLPPSLNLSSSSSEPNNTADHPAQDNNLLLKCQLEEQVSFSRKNLSLSLSLAFFCRLERDKAVV